MFCSRNSFLLFLSTFILSSVTLVSADGVKAFDGGYICDRLDEITLNGFGVFVDTDGSAGFIPTTGDLSIAAYTEKFVPASSLPIISSRFKVTNIEIQAICTLLEETSSGSIKAPSCHLEVDISYCKKLVAVELDPVKFERNIDLGFGTSGGGGRKLRGTPENSIDTLHSGSDEEDRDLQTSFGKCFGTKTGKIMATGTGPDDYAITGGVDGFFGAFGKIKGDIVNGVGSPVPLTYNAEIEVCVPRYYNPTY